MKTIPFIQQVARFAGFVALTAAPSPQAWAGDEVRIENRLPQSATIWFQAQGTSDWRRPPLQLAPGQRTTVALESPGKTFVAITSSTGKESRLGWLPLKQLASLGQTPTIVMRPTKKTVSYSVEVPHTEEIEQKYTVQVPVVENGVRKYVQEERTRTVQVTRSASEQRERTDEVPDLAVSVQGDYQNLSQCLGNLKLASLENQLRQSLPRDVAAVIKSGVVPDLEAAREINRILAQSNLLADVQFSTKEDGAVIMLQPLDESSPAIAVGTTDCEYKHLPYGYYWVWAKRDTRTSARQFTDVIQPSFPVFVDE